MKVSGIESIVCCDIAARQQLGIAKYGTTVADNPLALREWLEHQYFELLDAAIYVRRAIAEIDKDVYEEIHSVGSSISPNADRCGMHGVSDHAARGDDLPTQASV